MTTVDKNTSFERAPSAGGPAGAAAGGTSAGEPNQPPRPEGRILSTMNEDGSRRWLKPRLSTGRFWFARRIVAYALIAIFALIPFLSMNGKPLVLLDVTAREFTLFGKTFLPTDTLLLALFMMSVFVAVFLLTALLGRVWCGWACPQTVYMEFVYRPLERFFEGGKGGRNPKPRCPGPLGVRRALKYGTFLLASMFLAHTFLSYFVGVEQLWQWMGGSPAEHPVAFAVAFGVTGLMMLDFTFFREQVCIVMCPYGRFQSVMLDRNSLIITYDEGRGEPRGPIRRAPKRTASDVPLSVLPEEPKQGDCIDCTMCVQVCPTGIDIREGLQMECIGCAQCIDACDDIMDKVGRERGLIRYSSQNAVEGAKPHIVRPRIVVYPLILTVLVTAFVVTLSMKQDADVTLLPRIGAPFATLDSGEIANQVRIRVVNRTEEPATYTISPVGVEGARILPAADATFVLEPGESTLRALQVVAPPAAFERGGVDITLRVEDDGEFAKNKRWRLLGPGSFRSRDTAPDGEGE